MIVSILCMVDKYQETSVVIKWRRADISVLGGGRQKFRGSEKVRQVSEMTAVHEHLLTFLMCWEKLKKTIKWWPLQEYGDINFGIDGMWGFFAATAPPTLRWYSIAMENIRCRVESSLKQLKLFKRNAAIVTIFQTSVFCMCGVWKMCFSGQMSIKANFCDKLTGSHNRSPPVNHHRLCFNMTIMWELTVLQPSPFLRATGLLLPWFLWFSGLPVASQLSPIASFNPLQHSSLQRRRYDPMLALSPLKVECWWIYSNPPCWVCTLPAQWGD